MLKLKQNLDFAKLQIYLQRVASEMEKSSDPMLTTREAAVFLGVSIHFLYKDRASQKPKIEYVKMGTAVRYRRSTLQAYIAANSIKPE